MIDILPESLAATEETDMNDKIAILQFLIAGPRYVSELIECVKAHTEEGVMRLMLSDLEADGLLENYGGEYYKLTAAGAKAATSTTASPKPTATKCSRCGRRIPVSVFDGTDPHEVCWACADGLSLPNRQDLSVIAEELVERCIADGPEIAAKALVGFGSYFGNRDQKAAVLAIVSMDMVEWFASHDGTPGKDMDAFIAALVQQAGLKPECPCGRRGRRS